MSRGPEPGQTDNCQAGYPRLQVEGGPPGTMSLAEASFVGVPLRSQPVPLCIADRHC